MDYIFFSNSNYTKYRTSFIPSTYAESSVDPAPEIAAKVVNQNNGKKVLFDNTHGQTAGTADWVIDGGFSDFGNGIAKTDIT